MIDVHPMAPMQEKAEYVVRAGHHFPNGARVFGPGTRILAHREWVRGHARHLLAEPGEPEEAKDRPDPVETEDPSLDDADARTKAARRSPRRKG